MKKVILTAVLVSALSFANHAQTTTTAPDGSMREQRKNMTPAERSAKDASWAESKLALNADQKSKWQAASLERINANESLKEKAKGSTTPDERKQLRSQMKGNSDKFDAAVTGFLTPDQKTKYDAAKKEKHGPHHGKMKHAGPAPAQSPN